MIRALSRRLGQRYAFVVVGVIFLSLLAAGGVRSAPGVLMVPLATAFGWDRSVISFSAATGIFLYGMVGPFAAALMQRFGIRRVLLGSLALMAAATAASAFMSQPWHLLLTWGILSGLGSGGVAMVLGAAVVNRWFVARRGLVMGILSASTATGTLIFLPVLAKIAEYGGWRPVVLTIACALALLIPLAFWLLPEQPGDAGLVPFGAAPDQPIRHVVRANPVAAAFGALRVGLTNSSFWLLFGTFFICGLTTNGLVGVHLISFCADHGIPEVQAAGLLAIMGFCDLLGTTGSGWLTDRFDPRKLLFVYYAVRGLSLLYLPYSDFSVFGLSVFAVFYGLDWIATVPPTLRLANEAFGEGQATIMFGWIAAGHQIGAATAAWLGGVMRSDQGNYVQAFAFAGLAGLLAAFMSLLIGGRRRQARPQPA